MRFVLAFVGVGLWSPVCFGQADTSKVAQPPVQREVFIPGVDTPVSGPGLNAQVPVNTPAPASRGSKKRKTLPPSDPRGFGISLPLEPARKDTLRP